MAKKRRIALFINPYDHFERLCFTGIERFASQHGPWEYDSLTGIFGHTVTDLGAWGGDGVLGFLRKKETGEKIVAAGVAAVNISNLDPGVFVPAVRRDYATTGVIAAEYFLHRGYENHAFYGSVTPDVDMKRIVERSFTARLQKEGQTCSVLYQERESEWKKDAQRNHQELLDWLRSMPKPVAVLVTEDLRAARLLVACRDLGLNVPEDVAVLGKGNDEWVCKFTRPSLSSICEDYSEIGYQAAALLYRLMEGAKRPSASVLVAPGPIVTRQSTDVTVTGDVLVRKALRYIAQHACDPITVADVVGQLPIHRTRFEFVFRRALHRPPYTEITRVRMDRAKKLLAETSCSVSEVAAVCGFANYSSFSVAFKRETGVSPRTYRRQSRPAEARHPLGQARP